MAPGQTARGVIGVGEDGWGGGRDGGGGNNSERLRRPIYLRGSEHLFARLQFVFFTHRVLVTSYPKNCCVPCFYPRSVTDL